MELKRVVVTGLGALTPIGNSAEEFWKNLVAGTSGAAPITRFDASKFKTQFACEVKGYDPMDHFDRKEARKLDPFTQYAMITSAEAVADAGLSAETMNPDRIGVIWGSGIGGLRTFQDECLAFGQGDGVENDLVGIVEIVNERSPHIRQVVVELSVSKEKTDGVLRKECISPLEDDVATKGKFELFRRYGGRRNEANLRKVDLIGGAKIGVREQTVEIDPKFRPESFPHGIAR